jgi:hypothetical protein
LRAVADAYIERDSSLKRDTLSVPRKVFALQPPKAIITNHVSGSLFSGELPSNADKHTLVSDWDGII